MKLKRIMKNKKFKNICVTLLEIVVVAAAIMGILMAVQNHLQSKNKSGTGIKNAEVQENQEEHSETSVLDEYYIEINIKKNVVIVYQYTKDKSDKKAIRVMPASIGKSVKADKYKLKESYTWFHTENKTWNKYNVCYTTNGWIQSADYKDKYSWTLDSKSYNAIGTRYNEDSNIKLMAQDAQWIFFNCKQGTVVKVIKGKDDDTLPLEANKLTGLQKKCGWDPTDMEDGNPYRNVNHGTISVYEGTVYIEKGQKVDYLANVIALNEQGENITKRLKYSEFDAAKTGNYKVKYSYKSNDGKNMKATVKYEVIDTTVPVVKISKSKFTYEVLSADIDDWDLEKIKKEIENLVKSASTVSEGTIKVTTLPKEQLVVGDNPVRVVATDEAGNIGSAEATVEIKVKEKKLNEKYKPKNNKKEEKTTKKKKK